MHITVHTTRRDLIALPLQLLFRMPANLYFFGILWAAIFVITLMGTEGPTAGDIAIAALDALIAVVAGLLACLTVNTVFVALALGKSKGILGRHDLTLSPGGVREATDVNDSSWSWGAVPRIHRLRGCLIIQVNYYAAMPIPRRAFESDQAFEAFCDYAEEAWRKARLTPGAGGGAGRTEPESQA